MCCGLRLQTFEYNSISDDDIAEMVEIRGQYLEPRGQGHTFCSAVQFSSWIKAHSMSTKSITFGETEGSKQESKKAMFYQDM